MNLKKKAYELRKDVVEMIYRAKTGHIGGDLSVMEILVDLYYKQMNVTPENINSDDHDRFVLSKPEGGLENFRDVRLQIHWAPDQ